ncbi:MAG: hypothetical protein L0Z62_14050, partial [Gemmataceae bacterium]|nr:hypothetical protein [Gemmataceae bacterium]
MTVTENASPIGGLWSALFDAAGNKTGVRDPNTNLTKFYHDSLGRLTLTVDAKEGQWKQFFDAAGNVTETRDANNNPTQFLYDAWGRLTVTIDAQGNRTTS